MKIILTTLNARYAHASLGLRYLKANMAELKSITEICEFTIQHNIEEIVENIIQQHPTIVGFGVYIWNIEETTRVIRLLKILRPEIYIIIGGPEVSYEYSDTEIFKASDYLITGWGDISFPELCQQLTQHNPPENKVIMGIQPPLETLMLPYSEYTDHDIQQRTIYVEASRGCPFKCEFCLSSLDKTAWSFPLDIFMQSMDDLYQRGLRQFKFVDRTFNLKKEFTSTILNFFLEKLRQFPDNPVFLHFELVPDHLPDELKQLIVQFPVGALQFEIGIQTLYPPTQALISRRTNLVKAKENIQWLVEESSVHLHVDLIAGLPQESIQQFGEGFNELYSWQPHEIQLGILKRLRGTPIIRHTQEFNYKYSPYPPYSIMENNQVSFQEMNDIKRFAKYWELLANSARFKATLPLLLGDKPFESMQEFSLWLFNTTGKTYGIALDRLFMLVFTYLVEIKKLSLDLVKEKITEDFLKTGIQGWPKMFGEAPKERTVKKIPLDGNLSALPKRQQRHLQ